MFAEVWPAPYQTTGDNSLNGPTFGAPLPLLAAHVPVCVINRFQDPVITNTFDLATGQATTLLNLSSDVYFTNNATEVCPRCNPSVQTATPEQEIGKPGTCSTTARAAGAPCVIGSQVNVAMGAGQRQYLLSGACIPAQSQLTATVSIPLNLTTNQAPPIDDVLVCGNDAGPQLQATACPSGGTCIAGSCTGSACQTVVNGQCVDAKGGISQACCSTKSDQPYFIYPIERSGTPAINGQTGALAATFCIGSRQASLIDVVAGLPGPGALILPVQVSVSTPLPPPLSRCLHELTRPGVLQTPGDGAER